MLYFLCLEKKKNLIYISKHEKILLVITCFENEFFVIRNESSAHPNHRYCHRRHHCHPKTLLAVKVACKESLQGTFSYAHSTHGQATLFPLYSWYPFMDKRCCPLALSAFSFLCFD